MPLKLRKNIAQDTDLLFWEITESLDELMTEFKNLGNWEEEWIQISSFKSDNRKCEWIATRLLLSTYFNTKIKVFHDDFGKPYLDTPIFNISISHSHNLVVIAIGKVSIVGVDVELKSEKIGRIALKFLHQNEIERIDIQNDVLKLYLHWCAKEALYKVYGKKKLNFITNLQIDPIDENKGFFTGNIITETGTKSYEMYFMNYNDYIVVWTSKE